MQRLDEINPLTCVPQDVSECFGDEACSCLEVTCCQPSEDIVPPELSEDYFTAVFNLERMEM